MLLLLLLMVSSCKKEKERNTNFKCKVNGKLWRPSNTDLKYGHEAEAHLIDDGKTFFVAANQENSRQVISFAIFLDSDVVPGTYLLDGSKNSAGFEDHSKNFKFNSQLGYVGTLQILSLDKGSKTIKGKFSFKAIESNTQAVVEITEGEFNLRYDPY